MKRRLTLAAFAAAMACNALSLRAQAPLLTPTESVAPASVLQSAEPASASHLNELHQKEWVVLDKDNAITGVYSQFNSNGEAVQVAGVTVSLSRNGFVFQSTTTDKQGRFVFEGVGVGSYALVGKSEESLAVFAVHVLPQGASDKLDSDLVVFGTSIGKPVEQVLRSHVVAVNEANYYPEMKLDPVGANRTFTNSKIQLRKGGVLAGRLSRPSGLLGHDMSGNVAHVLSQGKVVGHASTNAKGEFEISNLAPGVYDFVAAGKDGIAVGSFQAVEATSVARNANSARFVDAVITQNSSSLNVEMVSAPDVYIVEETEIEGAPIVGGGFVGPEGFLVDPGFAPGGFAGGGMGGGGGLGGGAGGAGSGGGLMCGRAGLGALLGIGGLAAGVVALAGNDDGFNVPPATLVAP